MPDWQRSAGAEPDFEFDQRVSGYGVFEVEASGIELGDMTTSSVSLSGEI